MKDCIFCKIAKGEAPCQKVWENKDFLAFLDIRPKVEGMTVLITKKHFDSRVFNLPENIYQGFFKAAREVARLLKQKLKAERVFLVKEGAEINHAHIKLYPVKEVDTILREVILKRSEKDLKEVAEKIKA